ncbi:MAG: hypothetical protein P1U58_12055 [Verrucomicrobiales bacterium]|nr:hypothetical protein [Verrucomicrobiales bacterium]
MRFLVPLIAAALPALSPLLAQESESADSATLESPTNALPVGLPVKLDISRRLLKNFLSDETALSPYANGTEAPDDFVGAFSLGSPKARFVPIWDPVSCRLVGVLDIKAPDSPYLLLAEGPIPTSKASGASGEPDYFGMRLDGGRPEFLFTHGGITVAEMIWLEDDGEIMKQRFSFRKPKGDIRLIFPAAWTNRITPSVGTFTDNVLTVPVESAAEVTLLYRLTADGAPLTDRKEP